MIIMTLIMILNVRSQLSQLRSRNCDSCGEQFLDSFDLEHHYENTDCKPKKINKYIQNVFFA
jgi:hypothetical protein